MLTPQEKADFKKELGEEFVLFPKNKLYYIFGGTVAVILVATGLSLTSVFAYLRSEPAEIARARIEHIRDESETALKTIAANLHKSGDSDSRLQALEQSAVRIETGVIEVRDGKIDQDVPFGKPFKTNPKVTVHFVNVTQGVDGKNDLGFYVTASHPKPDKFHLSASVNSPKLLAVEWIAFGQ